jgi:hypothetical protein
MILVSVLYYLPLPQLCVRLASGGDPTYSFLVPWTSSPVRWTLNEYVGSPPLASLTHSCGKGR